MALDDLMTRELERFRAEHPRSHALSEQAKHSLLGGVPMHWMVRWPGGFPVFAAEAEGARFTDVDGHEYVDFCLGDTGAMTGHAPEPALRAIAAQAPRGITLMLPSEDSLWVGEEMARRFGLPYWQFALTATDANRFALRIARAITGRPKILVFNWCYHGTVDETFATLAPDGSVVAREGTVGPSVPAADTTRVVEFNDVEALERELAHGDVACVLAEPALTNIGIVLPEPGYHDALREATRRTGTLLIIDETHTICAGPGGYTAAHGLEPDILTIGKPLAAGVPAARLRVLGGGGGAGQRRDRGAARRHRRDRRHARRQRPLARRHARDARRGPDRGGVRAHDRARRALRGGRAAGHRDHSLDWHVTRLGCRVEYLFHAEPARTGAQAAAAGNEALDRFIHLYALNRGILLTPFHNMALMSPATTEADVDRHTEMLDAAARELTAAT